MWPPEAVILKSLLEQRMLEQHSALDRLAILASSLASISSYLAIPNRVPSLVSPDLPLSTPMSFNPAGLFSDAIIGPILISAFCSVSALASRHPFTHAMCCIRILEQQLWLTYLFSDTVSVLWCGYTTRFLLPCSARR